MRRPLRDLRRTDQHMTAKRRRAWWQRSRRQVRQELKSLLPRLDLSGLRLPPFGDQS